MRSGLRGAAVGTWMWIVLAVISTGCAGCAGKVMPSSKPSIPDMTGIVQIIGRFTIASGCPVGPRHIVTNAHVTDHRPFDMVVPAFPAQFQQGYRLGIAMPSQVNNYRDIAIMKVREGQPDLAMWYEVAEAGPLDGDTVYLQAYDWSSRAKAFAPQLVTSRVMRTVAGYIILDPAGTPGSSGSCVLNSAGQVVGINAFGKTVGFMGKQEVGGAVLFIKGLEGIKEWEAAN